MEFTEPVYRHPLEADSLLVRGTQGCSHNKCSFCSMSQGYRFMATTSEQMDAELRQQQGWYPATTRVYIVGANPFVLPVDKLSVYADTVRQHYPEFEEISMHSRITDIARKSINDLMTLKNAGIRHLYIGMESGNEEALRMMNKGHSARQTLEQLYRLNEVGIEFTPLYILGLGGKGLGIKSGNDTAELLNRVQARQISTTGLTVFPEAALHARCEAGEFIEAPEREKIEELLAFIKNMTREAVLYSQHYLNPVHFTIPLPVGKEQLVNELENFLAANSEAEIERLVNRKHMVSL